MSDPQNRRPNIVLILADDMGFSDIGCYGSEISTPNLDGLADNGLQFSQMYNSARCCPSRASLLTGLNPHQAGVGHMVEDLGDPAYQGYLNQTSVTIAESLRANGYTTLMSGKWHVGGGYNLLNSDSWTRGDATHPTPTQRGFDRFFGIVSGAGSYYYPLTLMRDNRLIPLEAEGMYLTDAISDNAVSMIEDAAANDAPFFLHVAYTAPHWPLHALEEDIARYEGKYDAGWDALRTGRHEELKGKGVLDSKWDISPRDDDAPPWNDAQNPDWESLRMATYSAQIDRMDQGIGRVLAKLRELGVEQDTMVMFLSDNGGCAEFLAEDSNRPTPSRYSAPPLDGRPMQMGNITDLRPGPADTFMSYDLPWANASNTPFRRFKRWTHEGGISTPFIMSWPAKQGETGIVHAPVHLIDVAATCLDVASGVYPTEMNGHETTPLEGESLLPVMADHSWRRDRPIFWEHEGSRAVRMGQWKLVAEVGGDWELYDMDEDRTELNNLAGNEQTRVRDMSRMYDEWAGRCGVLPWGVINPAWNPRLIGHGGHIV
ncbi:MAG: arylsulfatase [SAR202 cluster bacterium]|nr:arylsulfatase [SAR202 cluster bacterium]|tara:strand:- start:8467 stop:10098 length:1632 start_codon:yes stop_codon:yes gene_type:complete